MIARVAVLCFRIKSVNTGFFFLLLVNEVNFIVDFYHGAQQPVRDLQVLEDVQHVHLLVHRLWMTDVSDVDQQILEIREGQTQTQ